VSYKVWAYKKACKQCGKCCKEQVCLLGFVILKTEKTPCPALINGDGKYWCGLIKETEKYTFPSLGLSQAQIGKLREHLLVVNNFGEGCDLDIWHIKKGDENG